MASDSLLQSKTGEQSCEGKMRAETVKIVGAGKPGWGQELRHYEELDRKLDHRWDTTKCGRRAGG